MDIHTLPLFGKAFSQHNPMHVPLDFVRQGLCPEVHRERGPHLHWMQDLGPNDFHSSC